MTPLPLKMLAALLTALLTAGIAPLGGGGTADAGGSGTDFGGGQGARFADRDRGGQRWVAPLGEPIQISRPFRAPETPYSSGHRGVDMPANLGDPVLAPAAGTISFSGRVVDREIVSVRLDDGTVYSMEPVRGEAVVGEFVTAGEELGTVIGGGDCAEECVHLGVRVDGEYVNPMRYFFARPVLLPWAEKDA